MSHVLFVCLGNICRSPTAQGVFAARAKQAGLSVTCDSAGTGAWHIGKPPDQRAQAEAASRGVDLSPLRARQITGGDFLQFDLIIAMDGENQQDIEDLRPAGNQTPVRLFLDFAPNAGITDVPDPYYTKGFGGVFDLIETASDGLIAQLLAESQLSSAAAPHSL